MTAVNEERDTSIYLGEFANAVAGRRAAYWLLGGLDRGRRPMISEPTFFDTIISEHCSRRP